MREQKLNRSRLQGFLFAVWIALSGALVSAQEVADPDPWEGFNRKVFAFNDTLDRWVLRPLAVGYRAVTPEFLETGIVNVFDNLLEINNIVNDVLQGKMRQAGVDTGRFLINSTLGVAGLMDVADKMGLPGHDGEDFGQTLATWGSGQGPYLVLPFLGPSSVRDAIGAPVNSALNPIRYIDHVPTRNSTYGTSFISSRAELLDAEKLLSGDKYAYIRDAYLQRRNFLIKDGEVEDNFESDFEF